MEIKNSIALVTGANRGIGKAIVSALYNCGAARIYATARQIDTLADVIAIDKEKIIPLALDVTKPDQIEKVASTTQDVNLLINNAGVLGSSGFFASNSLDIARWEMETNYFGTLLMVQAFAPILKHNNGGVIVNLLSVASIVNAPLIGSYCDSKAALYSLTKGIRAQLAEQKTLVVGVFPGPVETDMAKVLPLDKVSVNQIADSILLGIQNNVEDVYPDALSQEVFSDMTSKLKALEKQFGGLQPEKGVY